MRFGSEQSIMESNTLRAGFLRLYGTLSIGDRIRSSYVLRSLAGFFQQGPGATMLDAGCGGGSYSVCLAQRYPLLRIDAFDVDRAKIERVRQIVCVLGLDNVRQDTLSILDLSGTEVYDLVLCIDVLEHINEDIEAVRRLAAAMKGGALLVIHVPQRYQKHYIGRQPEWSVHGHVREGYTPEEISSLLDQCGLRAVFRDQSFGLCGTLASDLEALSYGVRPLWLLLMPLIRTLAWLDTCRNHPRGNGVLIVARKADEHVTP